MDVDLKQVEEAAKELYIRALKILPPDIKSGIAALARSETDATAEAVLGIMIRNIDVAEERDNLLCQDTGIPIYNVSHRPRRARGRLCAEAGDTRGLRARDARTSAALLGGAPGDARERAYFLRPRRAGDQHRFLRCRGDAGDRDDPEGLGLGEQFLAEDGDPGRGRGCDQDLRRRLRARVRRQELPADDRRRRRRRHRRSVRASGQGRGDAAARIALRRSRGRAAGARCRRR